MSQTTTSIFASPGIVLPPTSSNSNSGRAPLTIPKLVVSDTTGKALYSWDLKLPKGTLGSADSCTICCPLPGIAPIHALLVSGARQAFVRSLAGKLTQDGVPASELLLSDEQCYFEIAGYRFNLLRASTEQVDTERKKAKRMQFALARPFNISSTLDQPAEQAANTNGLDAPWVANVIREAIEPLEAQIDSLLLPLAEFQAQSLQAQLAMARSDEEQRSLAEKDRQVKEQEILCLVAQQSSTMETLTQRISDVNSQLSMVAQQSATMETLTEQISDVNNQLSMVAQQSATMETLTERVSDVNNQLSTIERIIAQDAETNSSAKTEIGKVIAVQQSAIEQLQTGMVSVSESLKHLQERQQEAQQENSTWKNEVQLQLQQLTSAVSEFSSIAEGTDQTALVDAIESLKQTHEVAQLEIGRWQSGVQQQLQHLQETLQESEILRESEGKTQAEIPSVIAEALAEIQAKHDQSLLELQSWKSELKLEMQQLFQSASAAAVQSALESQAQALMHSDHNRQPSTVDHPAPNYSNLVEGLPTSTESQSETPDSDWTTLGSSDVVTQVQPELDEPVAQELVNDQFIAQFLAETDEPTPSWSDEQSDPAKQELWDNPLGSSDFVTQVQPELDEPVDQELINDQLISQVQAKTDEPTPSWSDEQSDLANQEHLDTATLSMNNDWPTVMVEHEQMSPELEPQGNAFTDQWTAHSNEDVLENSSASFRPFLIGDETNTPHNAPISADSSFVEYDPVSKTMHIDLIDSFDRDNLRSDQDGDSPFAQPGNLIEPESSPAEDHWKLDRCGFNEQDSPQIEPTATEDRTQLISENASIATRQELNEVEVTNGNSILPSWWSDDDEKESVERQESRSVESAPATYDLSHLYDESESEHEPQRASAPEATQFIPQTALENAKPDDDEQFFGFGLEESHQAIAQQPSSDEISIDQLALQQNEAHEPENVFDFTPRNASEQAQYASPHAEPQGSKPISSPSQHSGQAEDDSVETYMKSLLARMRGESAEQPEPPQPVPAAPVVSGYAPSEPSQQSAARQAAEVAANSKEPATPFDFENYVPLTNAPEKGKNISALRDLANSTARTAIHKSTRNRTLSGSLMKFAISAIALTVAAALFAINGLALNIAFIATLAALSVALIWGYDGLRSFKPLLQNSLVLRPGSGQDTEEDLDANS